MGTHPLENYNSYLRINSYSQDTISNAQRLCEKANLMKTIEHNLGLLTNHRGRVNFGGIVISNTLNLVTV